MKYEKKIRDRAYLLFVALRSYQRVTTDLRKEFPDECGKLRRQTVQAWAQREKWRARLRDIDRKTMEVTDQQIVGWRKNWLVDMQAIYDDMVESLINADINWAKSPTSTLAGLTALTKRMDELTGNQEMESRGIKRIALVLINILVQDKELGQKVLRKKDYLIQRIEDEMTKEPNGKVHVETPGA